MTFVGMHQSSVGKTSLQQPTTNLKKARLNSQMFNDRRGSRLDIQLEPAPGYYSSGIRESF